MDLKCAPCTDKHVTDGRDDRDEIPAAITIVTVLQTFVAGGQQIAAPVPMPVCYDCRQQQVGKVSKHGLVTA